KPPLVCGGFLVATRVTATSVYAGRMVHYATYSLMPWTFLVVEDHGSSAPAIGERRRNRAGARPDHGAGSGGHQAPHPHPQAHTSREKGALRYVALDLPAESVEGQFNRAAAHYAPQ